jgi:endonuclease-3
MPRESQAAKCNRILELIQILQRTYPDAHCELRYSNPLELLISTILSAQCTDKQVNRVTEMLFKKYRTASDFAGADLVQLQEDIRQLGFFRMKAKNIQSCCRRLVDNHNGQVPREMDALLQLNGVGRKTANVVLGNAFHVNAGIVVDTHVARLAQRLRLTRETAPEKIEGDLIKSVPREHWTLFSHWLIWHGRRRCRARKPDCPNCPLGHLCPSNLTRTTFRQTVRQNPVHDRQLASS